MAQKKQTNTKAKPEKQLDLMGSQKPASSNREDDKGSMLIPVVAGVAIIGLSVASYKAAGAYNLSQRLNIGVTKVNVLEPKKILTNGLVLGIQVYFDNPTKTELTVTHPSVEFGQVVEIKVEDKKTGKISVVRNFDKLIQSVPEAKQPYTIKAQSRTVTDYIRVQIPASVMLKMLGNLAWLDIVAAFTNDKYTLLQKVAALKNAVLNKNYGIKTFTYINGVAAPLPLIQFGK